MFQCSVCSFQSIYKYNVDRHEKVKHSKSNFTPHTINNNVTHQTGSDADVPMEQTAPSHSQNEMHSNQQEENVEQYKRLQQVEKLQLLADPFTHCILHIPSYTMHLAHCFLHIIS